MTQTFPPPKWVATQPELQSLVKELSEQSAVAIDTESNSLHAYRERVCLIQISTTKTDYLVDPLALDDISLLGEIFTNPNIEKVFHAAEYDLICLKRDFGFTITNLFDTRWAVRILGYTKDGLDGLLSNRFKVKVNKKHQKANWGKRPLSPEQIHYARMDTHFLLPLGEQLQAELDKKGLVQLAQEDFERASNVEIPVSKPVLWERMANNHKFSPRELTILKELFDCREKIAEKLTRPPFKVMSDKQLIEIAQMPPKYKDDLFGLGMSNKQVMRWGTAVLKAVEKGQTKQILKLPQQAKRPDEAYLTRLDSLRNWRKSAARKMQVESDVILPRPLMDLIAESGPRSIPELSKLLVSSPWRMTHFGSDILNTVKG